MINLSLSVSNPFSRSNISEARDLLCLDRRLSRNKSIELQASRWSSIQRLLEVEIETGLTGRDHAGPRLYIDVMGFFISLQIYDHRHWDHENDRWEAA